MLQNRFNIFIIKTITFLFNNNTIFHIYSFYLFNTIYIYIYIFIYIYIYVCVCVCVCVCACVCVCECITVDKKIYNL